VSITDASGKPITLDRKIGEGGEGAVFLISQQPELVAKVYLKPLPSVQVDKLRAMVASSDSALSGIAAWPQSVILKNGTPIGFTMPRLTSQFPIHELFGPKRRQVLFPRAQWKYLVHAGVNLSSGFHALHSRNVVVGDVNSNNVVVYEDAMIRFIDCDSFQIKYGTQVFPCIVGVPEYQPPELQNRDLAQAQRTQQQDLFGLAVLLFQLLFVGKHPFAGVLPKATPGGAAPADNIMQGRFFYSDEAIRQGLRPPPGSPALGLVTPTLGRMFGLAFNGSALQRPSAEQWRTALAELEQKTVQCAANPSHWYNSESGSCPWCTLEAGSNAIYFVVPILSTNGAIDESIWTAFPNSEVERLWREISAVRPPPLQETLIKKQARYSGKPLPTDIQKNIKRYVIATAACAFGALVLTAILNNAYEYLGWILFIVVGFVMRPDAKAECAQRRSDAEKAAEEVNYAFSEWKRVAENSRFVELRAKLARLNQEMQNQRTNYDAAIKELEANRERDERKAYMDSHTIANAKISGIGKKTAAMLLSFGYETALDINIGVTNIRGIKYTKYAQLDAWRRRIEAGFRFDRNKGLSPAILRPFKARYIQARISGRTQMMQGASQLSAIAKDIETQRPALLNRATMLADRMWQTAADLKKAQLPLLKR
jgi:DNA-binding helix-hairpin-helix protein with protein kinase domain